MDDCEGFRISVDKVTADMNMARELELETKNEDVMKLLPSHHKFLTHEELFLMQKHRKLFLKMGICSW